MTTVRALAAEQHSVVATAQLRRLGLGRAARRHLTQSGAWELVTARVVRLAGSPPTAKQELMAAVFDAGPSSVVSHESAAALWGLPGFTIGPVEVSRPRSTSRARPTLGEVHDTRVLPDAHRTTSDGIPVTTVARTLFDLAGSPGLSEARVERAVDNAISLSPPVLPMLRRVLAALARQGRPGIVLMRSLLDDRPADYIPPASGLEARVIGLLAEVGIATRRQVDLGGEHWIGRVDLVVEGAPVVVECDSAIHHSSKSDRDRDRRRDGALAALGLTVVRVTEDEAFHRPWLVAPRVDRARRSAA